MFIKNFPELAKTPERKIVLELIESALKSIQPEEVFRDKIKRHRDILEIDGKEFDLNKFERVFLLGFGKGAAGNSLLLAKLIHDHIAEGFVIDTKVESLPKIEFMEGTHPLPSKENFKFTQKVVDKLSNLSERDLVLII